MEKLLPQAHSYATAAGAEKALKKIFGDRHVLYVIAAQEDGRFSPMVLARKDEIQEMFNINAANNYKFGVVSH